MNKELFLILKEIRKWAVTCKVGCYFTDLRREEQTCRNISCKNCLLFQSDKGIGLCNLIIKVPI